MQVHHFSGLYCKIANYGKYLVAQLHSDLFSLNYRFSHEIVMAVIENGKLVIFTGCSHNGILNMIDTVAKEFEGVPIKAVIGGFHLVASPPFNFLAETSKDVENIGKSILNYSVEVTYTGHCTGKKAFNILESIMGDRIKDMPTGSSFDI